MAVNRDKPDLWKQDIAQSVDMYNDWFMRFAPQAYRTTRVQTTKDVEATLKATKNLTDVGKELLKASPSVLPSLRMATCPPLAVDRLIGLAGWLIPSEFMDVNYGASMKRYLFDKVKLLQIHRFDPNDVQFADALVSSAVVWFRREPAPLEHEVLFTYGGSLERPKLQRLVSVETLRRDPKWTRYPMKADDEGPGLGDFFKIKRGLATGNNSYFILSADEIEQREFPMDVFRPILPSPRHLPEDEVMSDKKSNPVLHRRLFLLECQLEEAVIKKRYPKLWAYLEEGKAQGIAKRYLCRHRTLWYTQENRPPPPFLCTYLGRSDTKNGRPFRFILNNSDATAASVYLMLYPRELVKRVLRDSPHLKRQIWQFLNEICPQAMVGEGRVYGGGLHKLEPKEVGNVPAAAIAELLPESAQQLQETQGELF